MLGVATLIVVNSVMDGFSTKLKDRLHGLLSDVVIESPSDNGFPTGQRPEWSAPRSWRRQRPSTSKRSSATLEVLACGLQVGPNRIGGRFPSVVGIEPVGRRRSAGSANTSLIPNAGPILNLDSSENRAVRRWTSHPPFKMVAAARAAARREAAASHPPPSTIKPVGAIVGTRIAHYRGIDQSQRAAVEEDILPPGYSFIITITAEDAARLRPIRRRGLLQGEMSEYDSNYVFVPLNYLQSFGRDGGPGHEHPDPPQESATIQGGRKGSTRVRSAAR